jgi:peptidoglycan biosynthesis protein MviN/MurJ (putative lipid II flippase)
MLLTAVTRVAYPAMSRLLEAREDPAATLERALMSLAVLTGAVAVALAGFAPALPALVGADWGDAPAVLLWSGVALVLTAPVSVTMSGYLFAANDPGAVALAALASTVVWFAVTGSLLPVVGAPAVGLGWIAGGLVDALLLGRAARRRGRVSIVRPLAATTVVALAATASAWAISDGAGADLLSAAAGMAAGAMLMLAGCAVLARAALDAARSILSLGLRGLGATDGRTG